MIISNCHCLLSGSMLLTVFLKHSRNCRHNFTYCQDTWMRESIWVINIHTDVSIIILFLQFIPECTTFFFKRPQHDLLFLTMLWISSGLVPIFLFNSTAVSCLVIVYPGQLTLCLCQKTQHQKSVHTKQKMSLWTSSTANYFTRNSWLQFIYKISKGNNKKVWLQIANTNLQRISPVINMLRVFVCVAAVGSQVYVWLFIFLFSLLFFTGDEERNWHLLISHTRSILIKPQCIQMWKSFFFSLALIRSWHIKDQKSLNIYPVRCYL